MDKYRAEDVVNGTFGHVWVNSMKMAQCEGLQAKVTLKTADVNMCGDLARHTKVIGREGKGTLKLNKVSSEMILLISDNIKKGKQTVCTVISKLADPSSLGAERIALKEVCFEEITLIDWEAKKLGKESIPFTFSDWELLDVIEGN